MLLIYSHITSPRLQYICDFIFREMMGVEFSICINSEEFKQYEGARFNYSDLDPGAVIPAIHPHGLLFEHDIHPQDISCFETNGNKAFFKTDNNDFPFDILAASFYLISRYEEYLSYDKDEYGRYSHKCSLAFREGFLEIPLINIWIKGFAEMLLAKYSFLVPRSPVFQFIPTYDIDIAWSYKHKGWWRNLGGFLKKPSMERIRVLLGLQQDPFDAYEWLHEFHEKNGLLPIYFFLVAERNGKYDKNILPFKKAMWKLVGQHAARYPIGLHPSWQSGDHPQLLKKEIEWLYEMSGDMTITRSRQHYIRFSMPETYRLLIEAGIREDYSMGYGTINGFRASVANPFYWFDLERNEVTGLQVYPFCFMDANSYYEQKLTVKQAEEEMRGYYKICLENGGVFVSVWHNNFLGGGEWREVYEKANSSVPV